MAKPDDIKARYRFAQESYFQLGVETEAALDRLNEFSISLHCWQGDDVGGFEPKREGLEGSGIQVTGNYPGKARSLQELQSDLQQVYALVPGSHRLNLHAMYGDFGGRPVERDQISQEHFKIWVEWAKDQGLGLDFNATCFAHPLASSGYTLASKDEKIRSFWIRHVQKSRAISAFMGQELKNPCVHNLWIPDGAKDVTIDRWTHRELLRDSLDKIFAIDYDPIHMKDSLESKLFGIGSETYVVGSHEFYLGYALTRGKMICLDLGHFHPTENVADKISALLQFSPELLLHISRGVRWDSDHVVILNDEVKELLREVVCSQALGRTHIALDFFDASMNRVGAWVIGARAVLKAVLLALLEPTRMLCGYEENGDFFKRLASLEGLSTLPFGAVWETFCLRQNVPTDFDIIDPITSYERNVTSHRT
ncbi:MAG: L-rhamnose isomerase [Candidatus Aminicenantes bacterium]|nr:L-rhamnose isomerase [Candidatus Aminicenantes bacterium]